MRAPVKVVRQNGVGPEPPSRLLHAFPQVRFAQHHNRRGARLGRRLVGRHCTLDDLHRGTVEQPRGLGRPSPDSAAWRYKVSASPRLLVVSVPAGQQADRVGFGRAGLRGEDGEHLARAGVDVRFSNGSVTSPMSGCRKTFAPRLCARTSPRPSGCGTRRCGWTAARSARSARGRRGGGRPRCAGSPRCRRRSVHSGTAPGPGARRGTGSGRRWAARQVEHRCVERPPQRVDGQDVEPAVEHHRGQVVQRVEQHPDARGDRVLRRDPAPLAGLRGEGGEQPVEVGAFVVVQTQHTSATASTTPADGPVA